MSPEVQRVRNLFVAAVKLPPEQWETYLKEACDDDELRRQAIDLLREHQQAGSFLDRPAAHVPDTGDVDPSANGVGAAAAQEGPGATVGPYKLLELIGEGGMGTVWMAEQREPVQRKVALKIIKAGMDTRQVVARFEAERQALALMDHPNIAKVLDGGATAGGRPYFVMELVKGVPITRYCDEHRLTPRQRLELFLPVCQAIQHAHTKGLIHRDVKPANVLVAPYDGVPVPKVIDFGVAKATGKRLTERTLFTGFGTVVGTLEYMSPEQAELNNQDIDTRSDIYSLGVLLYELLTGTTPLNRERLKQAAFTEMLRIIREEDPPQPSTRLSESQDSLPSIAAQRHMEPAKLTKAVRGELDWIVMKALEKDRRRRYETANGLAADVQHYLADEPVLACPPTFGYRLRKMVRRNKTTLAIVGLALVVLVLLVGGGGWVLRDRAARREQAAQLARASLADARKWIADNKLALAHEELGIARGRMAADRAALGGLAAEIEALDAELGRYQRFLYLVERAHEAEFPQPVAWPHQPDAAGGKDVTPAQATSPVREPDKAVPFLLEALSCYGIVEHDDWNTRLERAALEPNQVAVVRRTAYEELLWLADDVARRGIDHGSGQKTSPHEAAEAGLAYLRRAEAAHLPTTAFYLIRARLLKGDGKQAEAGREESLARRTPATIALDHYLLAVAAYGTRNKVEAVREYEEALRVEPTHYWSLLGLAAALNNLGQEDADFALAAAAYTGCILNRPDHALAYVGRGFAYARLGRYKEAEAEYRQALRLRPDYPAAHNQLGFLLSDHGRNAEAEAACREAIRLEPGYARAYETLGLVLLRQGKVAGAARFLAEAFAAQPNVADDLATYNRYNAACFAARAGCGQGDDAATLDETERARLRRQALDWLRADLAARDRLLQNEPAQARPRAQQVLRLLQRDPDFDGVRGDGLAALPAPEREAWQKFWGDVERTLSAPHLQWDDPRTWLDHSRLLEQSGKHEQARQFRAEARALCQKDPALVQDNPDYAAAYANLLLKDGVAPGTVVSLPWQKSDLHIRYPQRRATIPPDPILYFTFDEDTVQKPAELMFAADLSGNGFHGTGQGVSFDPAGKVGGCLAFGGGKLRLPGSLMNRLSEYTFTAWMYQETSGGPAYEEFQYFNQIAYDLTCDMFVNTWNGSRQPDRWKGGQPVGLVVPRGQWYFAAVRLRNGGVDAGTVDVFINGNRSEIPGQRMEGDDSAFGVFRGAAGKLDEVAIYDRALSDDEIRALSEQTADVPAPAKEQGK